MTLTARRLPRLATPFGLQRMSPGSTALSCGTVITPLWISTATARSRIVPLR